MRIKIYDVDQNTGDETFNCQADLAECFESDDPELIEVEAQLHSQGRAWVGGGAAPLRLLMRVR
jgi:hypothetical protein